MALIAQMVARDESGRHLYEVLDHLFKLTETVVFTDDASTDDTVAIAESFGCYTYQMEKPTFTTNEGLLRQTAWQNLSEHAQPNDWILCIDADEKLYGIQNLPGLMDQKTYDVLGITFVHMWNATQYRVDKLWQPNISSRMFRYYQGGEFAQRRLACGSEPTYVQELIRQNKMLWKTPLVMQHLGYKRDEDKISKYKRYSTLDGGQFHQNSHIESILDPHPTLVNWNQQ